MSTIRILLARHGETDANVNRVFQGQGGGPLNATGREQARKLSHRVAPLRPHAIVSSDLTRAVETAEIVADVLGLVPSADPALREIDVGGWSGLSIDQVAQRFPEELAGWESGSDIRRGGGETYGELALRMRAAIERLADGVSEGPVLVVSHGAALRALACSILGLSPPGPRTLGGMHNASLSVAVRENGKLGLLTWNDFAHLAEGAR